MATRQHDKHDGSGAAGKDVSVAALVLAGGSSRRFGADNKLLADTDGRPLIRHVVERVLASRVGYVVVVTGNDAARIEAALAGLNVVFVHNPRHLEGMGTTVATGIKALPGTIAVALVTPGDLPDLSAALIDRLLAIADAAGRERIVYPTLPTGEQRNPVLWPRDCFPELAALGGDTGARGLVKKHAARALPVAMTSVDAFADIDRPEDLQEWRQKRKPVPAARQP